MARRQGLGRQARRRHPQRLRLVERLEPDGLVRVAERLDEDRQGGPGVAGVALGQLEEVRPGPTGGPCSPGGRARRPWPLAFGGGRLADEADVGAEGEVLELLRRCTRSGTGFAREALRRRSASSLANRASWTFQAWSKASCSVGVEVAEEPGGADLELMAAVDEHLGQGVDGRLGDLPVGLVPLVVDQARRRTGRRRPGRPAPRWPARPSGGAEGSGSRGRPGPGRPSPAGPSTPRIIRSEQGPRADLVPGVVEEDDQPVLARRPEGQRGGDLAPDGDDLAPPPRRRRARPPRRRRGRPGRRRPGTSPPGRRAGAPGGGRRAGRAVETRARARAACLRIAACGLSSARDQVAAARRGRPARRGRRGRIRPA